MARSADPGLAERRRRQIMDAALACFRRRGFHQSSMHEICAEAEMSPGAVYRYFPSKTDIIAAIAEDDQRQADESFPATMSGEDLIETLCFFAQRFVDLAATSGDAPLVADVLSEALRDREFALRLVHAAAPFHQRIAGMIAAGQHMGEFDPTLDANGAARIILGALDGLCLRASVRGDGGAAIASDVRIVLERLLKPQLDESRLRADSIARVGADSKSARISAHKESIP